MRLEHTERQWNDIFHQMRIASPNGIEDAHYGSVESLVIEGPDVADVADVALLHARSECRRGDEGN